MFMSLANDAVAEGQGEEGQEGADQGDVGAEAEEQVVGAGGDDVFLDQQFHAVGQRLQPAELAADAGGAEAVLDAAGDLALQPHGKDRGNQHEGDKGNGRDQGEQVRPGMDKEGPNVFKHFRNGSESRSTLRRLRTGVTLCTCENNGNPARTKNAHRIAAWAIGPASPRSFPEQSPLAAGLSPRTGEGRWGVGTGPLARDPQLARLEAALLAADEPLSTRNLASATGIADAATVRRLVRKLQTLYDQDGTAFQVEELAGGFQLLTRRNIIAGWSACAAPVRTCD